MPEFSRDGKRVGLTGVLPKLWGWNFIEGETFRVFTSRGAEVNFENADFSADGSLFLGSGSTGIILWDFATGREIAQLPLPRTFQGRFQDASELLSCGDSGLYLWPVHQSGAAEGMVTIGPPKQLDPLPGKRYKRVAVSSGGQRLAAIFGDNYDEGALVFDPAHPEGLRRQFLQGGVHSVALSPDGKWLATANWNGHHIRIWEVESDYNSILVHGRMNGAVVYSPDGRWIAAT